MASLSVQTTLPIIDEQSDPHGRSASWEPDIEYQRVVRAKIEENLRHLVDEAREVKEKQLVERGHIEAEAAVILQNFEASKNSIRRIAEERFSMFMQRARNEGAPLPLNFAEDQQAILDAIKMEQAMRSRGQAYARPRSESSSAMLESEGGEHWARSSRPDDEEYPPSDRSRNSRQPPPPGGSSRGIVPQPFSGISAGRPASVDLPDLGREGVSRRPSRTSLSQGTVPEFWRPPNTPDEPRTTSRTFTHATAPLDSPVAPNRREGFANNGRLSRSGSIQSSAVPLEYDAGVGPHVPRESPEEQSVPIARVREKQREVQQQQQIRPRMSVEFASRRFDDRPQAVPSPGAGQFSASEQYPFYVGGNGDYSPSPIERKGIPIRGSSRASSMHQGSPESLRNPSSRISANKGSSPHDQSPTSSAFNGPQSLQSNLANGPSRALASKRSFTSDDDSRFPQTSPSIQRLHSPQVRRNSAGSHSIRSQRSRLDMLGPPLLEAYDEQSVHSLDDGDWDDGLDLLERRQDLFHAVLEVDRKTVELHKKEEEIRQKEEDARKKEDDARKKEEDARRKEEYARQVEQKVTSREEQLRRLEGELRTRECDVREREAEASRREREIKCKEDEAKQREDDARQTEKEMKLKEQEVRQQEEEVRHRAEEAARMEEIVQKHVEETSRMEEEARRLAEEAVQREAEAERLEMEARRKGEELDMKLQELRLREEKLDRREAERLQAEEVQRLRQESTVQEARDRERVIQETAEREKIKQQQAVRQQVEQQREEERRAQREAAEEIQRQAEARRHEEDARRRDAEMRAREEARRREAEKYRQAQEASRRQPEERQEEGRKQEERERLSRVQQEIPHPDDVDLDSPDLRREQEVLWNHFARNRNDSLSSDGSRLSTSPRSAAFSTTAQTSSSAAASAPRNIPIPDRTGSTIGNATADRNSTASSSSYDSTSGFSAFSGHSGTSTYTQASSAATSSTPTPSVKPTRGGWKPAGPPPTSATSSHQSAASASSLPPPTPQEEEAWKRRQREQAKEQAEKFQRMQEEAERERYAKSVKQMSKEEVIKVFEAHNSRWSRLSSVEVLTWYSFPWPTFQQANSPEDLTMPAMSAYVLSPHHPNEKKKSPKDLIKDYIKRWHPDRFETKFLPKVREEDKVKVKEGAGVVARNLNELLTKQSNLSDFAA